MIKNGTFRCWQEGDVSMTCILYRLMAHLSIPLWQAFHMQDSWMDCTIWIVLKDFHHIQESQFQISNSSNFQSNKCPASLRRVDRYQVCGINTLELQERLSMTNQHGKHVIDAPGFDFQKKRKQVTNSAKPKLILSCFEYFDNLKVWIGLTYNIHHPYHPSPALSQPRQGRCFLHQETRTLHNLRSFSPARLLEMCETFWKGWNHVLSSHIIQCDQIKLFSWTSLVFPWRT